MPEDRRTVLAEAGLAVLATKGARGLTHRAVDQLTGLPEGSTSYYFRTRSALLQACAEQLVARTMQAIGETLASAPNVTQPELAELAAHAVYVWTGDNGLLVLARHELLLESARDAQLRQTITAASDYIHELLKRRISDLGIADASERAAELVACLDGIALAAAVDGRSDQATLTRTTKRVVTGILSQP